MKFIPSRKQWKAWSFPTKITVFVSYLAIISFALTLVTKFIINPKEDEYKEIHNTTDGSFSPAISTEGDNSDVIINYNFENSEDNVSIPKYELFYQKIKNPQPYQNTNKYYELGFKNITKKPINNFEFTLIFEQPVDSINYEYRRSSSNFTGGKGLYDNGKKFNWRGNQISENNGWVVFLIKTNYPPPVISKIYTNVTGIFHTNKQIILADSDYFRN